MQMLCLRLGGQGGTATGQARSHHKHRTALLLLKKLPVACMPCSTSSSYGFHIDRASMVAGAAPLATGGAWHNVLCRTPEPSMLSSNHMFSHIVCAACCAHRRR